MEPERSAEYERLLRENARYVEQFDRSALPAPPLSGLAILTCMDARISLDEIFGLLPGDANVIRNAGAVATDDAIRSLVISQWLLGTTEVVVVGHTGCGLRDLPEERLRLALAQQTGHRAELHFGSFGDLEEHVRAQVRRIAEHPWIRAVPVHGLVYEVETGRVRDVADRPPRSGA